MSTREDLIDAIASFMTNGMAMKSIELQMGKPSAVEWARVVSASGVRGWFTKEEAVAALNRTLAAFEPPAEKLPKKQAVRKARK